MHIMWINEPADFTGGCEQYIFQTAQSLKKCGYKNTILYDVDGDISPKFLQPFDNAFPIVDIKRQVKEAAPDIIYIHRLTGKKILEFLKCGIPTVRFFHDHKLFCLREHKYRTLSQQTCTKPVGLRCYPCLGFVQRKNNVLGVGFTSLSSLKKEIRWNRGLPNCIVASHYMKSHLIAHGFFAEKIKVIPLYAAPPTENKHTRESQTLLFVGQLVRGKGVDILIRALALLSTKPKLWIVGSGRQENLFRQLCKEVGVEEQVLFLGKKQSVTEYYQKCTCVVLPSRSPETFALIGPEAMRYQTPVIATDVGGISDWLRDKETGFLVPPNDPRKLADAIELMLQNNDMRIKMGENAQKGYWEKFTPDKHMTNLTTFFETLTK